MKGAGGGPDCATPKPAGLKKYGAHMRVRSGRRTGGTHGEGYLLYGFVSEECEECVLPQAEDSRRRLMLGVVWRGTLPVVCASAEIPHHLDWGFWVGLPRRMGERCKVCYLESTGGVAVNRGKLYNSRRGATAVSKCPAGLLGGLKGTIPDGPAPLRLGGDSRDSGSRLGTTRLSSQRILVWALWEVGNTREWHFLARPDGLQMC